MCITDLKDPYEIRVMIEQESVLLGTQAKVRLYRGNTLISEIVGKIEKQQGADGRFYPSVSLCRVE